MRILLIFVIIATLRTFIDSLFGNKVTLIIYGLSLVFLVIICLKKGKTSLKTKNYPLILIFMFLPSIFDNYYLKDGVYSLFFYYLLTLGYFIILSYLNVSKKNINFVLNLFVFFSIATCIITWLSVVSPDFYTSKIIPWFPKGNQAEILYNFTKFKNRSGLCTHYSRNAFFMILGIVGKIYFYFEKRNKKDLFIIMFLLISLFMVGKRGHLIFFIFSFVITYFIFNRVSKKTFVKFLAMTLIIIILTMGAIKANKEVGFVFERLMNNSSKDISNGRYEMYNDVWCQFKDNDYIPLGWAEYASSTNYVHPGVHNDYIQLFCETGIIGFVVIIGLNIIILFKAVIYSKTKNGISFIVLLYNIFFLAYSFTGLPHYDIETYMFYFLINFILYYESSNKKEWNRLYE